MEMVRIWEMAFRRSGLTLQVVCWIGSFLPFGVVGLLSCARDMFGFCVVWKFMLAFEVQVYTGTYDNVRFTHKAWNLIFRGGTQDGCKESAWRAQPP